MIGTNPKMDADFLNIHIQKYQNISLDKKNIEASRRIQFIDDQLIGLSDSLLTTETRLQQFRSANRVMDLSVQGQAIIAQLTRLENDKAQLSLEANYYDYLAEYLDRSSVGEMPMVPITMGITDPGLTRLVEELTDLQGQFSTTGAGEKNPLQRNLDLRVQSARESLKETLNGLRRANSLARSENQQQINRANSQASSLPVTERQLLGIERKFKLNDELYTFLLEARAEQHMKKASNRADSEIIDPADVRFSSRISPNPPKIYLAGILIAFMLAFAIIFLKSLFSNKIKHDDIKKMTEIPVIGRISHNDLKTNTVVFDDPDSAKAEAFRLLRSRMQFITKDATSPVILVTSSAPEDGKTYISINLASAYSLLGKKTIIIGFDLRKPKIFQDFNLNNDKGVSTYLIGQDDLEKVIMKTSYENLSVIPGGPIPPNPSELIALEKTKLLLNSLKERYDFIIVDTPPLGIVSDTFHLASLADACLIVVRPGHTLKKMFATTLNEIKNSRMNSLGLIINDLHRENKQYGYSEKYSYKSGKKRTLRNILTKRNI